MNSCQNNNVEASQSNSEDDTNNITNDCNFLLNDKKNAETSIFDDSTLAMVSN
jgi:hypothetical protein